MSGSNAERQNQDDRPARLIDLGAAIVSPIGRTLFRLIKNPVEQALSLSAINDIYALASPSSADRNYFATALRTAGVSYHLAPEDLAKIPPTGPLVVVANHPFGVADGLIMGDILTQIRPDFRLLANRLLHRIPELRPWILPVDVLSGAEAAQRNASQLRLAMKWVAQAGVLGIFPSGTVSHLHLRQGCIADPAWHRTVAVLVRRTGATVITMFFEGRNSLAFQLCGLIHPRLRTALLPSEFVKGRRSRVCVRIEYLVRNAECKILFGPVSISRAYAGLSRRLMVEFLSKLRGHHELGSLVRPRNPPRERLTRPEREALAALVHDTEDVSALVSDIEVDRKGLPVLLRHYLRMGASLLSFNVDQAFGNCIDGLIIVDLRATDPCLLRRYMGKAGYEHYASVTGPAPLGRAA